MKQDERGLYGIYEVWHQPFWQTTWFAMLKAFVALFLSLGVIVWLVRKLIRYIRYKRQTPWQRAMQELNDLVAVDYRSSDQIKAAYFRLTDILKRYLTDHMKYDVIGKTDQEMLIYVQKNKFPEASLEHLSSIVHGGLMVKFAQVSIAQENLAQHINVAIKIVQETKE